MVSSEEEIIRSQWFCAPFEKIMPSLTLFFTPEALEKIVPFLKAALQFGMPLGRYTLIQDSNKNDLLYANVEEAKGRGKGGSSLEAHEHFIDIHAALHGKERIGILPLSRNLSITTPYNTEKDICFFSSEPKEWIDIYDDIIAVIPPGVCHSPLSGDEETTKLILKIDTRLCKARLCNISLKTL